MSAKLDDIRKKIDSLDNQIHDLLMERADLIMGVTEEKKKNNIPVVQPAREAVMIRRLLGRHRGPLPEAAIVGIWRELVGAVSLLQTGLKVAVSSAPTEAYCWDMAKNYFGTVLPMTKGMNSLMAVSSVRENESNFAVVPWPQDGEKAPWWPFLMNQKDENPSISKRSRLTRSLVRAPADARSILLRPADMSPRKTASYRASRKNSQPIMRVVSLLAVTLFRRSSRPLKKIPPLKRKRGRDVR
jgi:chorismate mutase-like protein